MEENNVLQTGNPEQEPKASDEKNTVPRNKIKLTVHGMTCASCDVLIERRLHKVPGVTKVSANHAKGEVKVEGEGFTMQQLQEALAGEKYVLAEHKETGKWPLIGAVLIILLGGYLAAKNYLPNLGITENMSLGFVFLIGLVAAFSTCLAVSGGLLLAISAKHNEAHPDLNRWQKFKPHIFFNIGRIASYTLLGGIIGLIGAAITISPKATGIITITAAVLMVIIGLQLLGIKIPIKFAHKGLAHKIHDKGSESGHPLAATLFGASTFFLPCGFTVALQLYVLSKGDALQGALTMLAFSLGTLPALLFVGAISSWSKGQLQKYLTTAAAVVVIVLGLANIPSGFALIGVSTQTIPAEAVEEIDGYQIAEMKVVGLEYIPSTFTVQVGRPVKWIIDGSKAEGCAQVITAPKLKITEYLPDSKKTITFTPDKVGKIPFSCTMGMTTPGAAFIVVNESADTPPSLPP